MLKLVTMRRPHAIRTKRAYDSALPPISPPCLSHCAANYAAPYLA